MKPLALVISILLVFGATTFADDPAGERLGVYEYVVQRSTLDFDATVAAIESRVGASAFDLVASLPVAVPEGCDARARVLVLYDPTTADRIIELQPATGPFALALRINVFEDELGVHVSIVNPVTVNRTILLDDPTHLEWTESIHVRLRELISEAGFGDTVAAQYGPMRKRGHIGKTMGVMAGGPYDKKIKTIFVVDGGSLGEVVAELERGLKAAGEDWQLHHAYTLAPTGHGIAILGITGETMERRSFSIVKEGSDPTRRKLSCPGIAHAAAYPFELVVAATPGGVHVQVVESMYRMKMFFEDAGKWAFMKNMKMPGSIQRETEGLIKSVLAEADAVKPDRTGP